MPGRHGITNTPIRKRMELAKKYIGFRNFRIEKKFSNQEEAQKWEDRPYRARPRGPKIEGPFYGYSHFYKRKR